MRPRSDLRHIQNVGVQYVIDHPEAMLGLQMGFGKSIIVLTAARYLIDSLQVNHILIIAPLLVADETWPDEIEGWEHANVLSYEVLTGSVEQRTQRARRMPEISIINTENVAWLVEFWGDDWPYDMVVADEISRFKNPSMKTKPTKLALKKAMDAALATVPKGATDEQVDKIVTKAIKKVKGNRTRFWALASVRGYIERFVGLTGTMAPNGLLDIWAQYYLIDRGERLLPSYNQYRTRWFDSDYKGFNYVPKPGAFERIVEQIGDITLSMKTTDYIDMPPVILNTLTVRLPPKVMAQYRKFEKTLLLEDYDIEAVNQGVLTGKLLQLANGSVYDEDGNVIEIHSLKLDMLDSVIEEAAGQPVLVAYSFQFDLEKLRARYPQAEVAGEVKDLQRRWNAKEIPILLAHPQSAGHGLNLQYGGHITVWYGLTWSLEYYQQLNTRLHRPGQAETVVIHHIVAEGTVDERVMAVLPEKEAVQDDLTEATKYTGQ